MVKISMVKEWLGKDAEPSKRRVVQAIKLFVLICLFAGLFWVVPITDVLKIIKSVNPFFLVLGIALGFPNLYLKSVSLGYLTRKQNLMIPYNRLFIVNLMVKFYMLFVPGAIIGSGIRWAKISPEGKSAEALAAVAVNRFLETFLIIATGLFWFLTGINKENNNIFTLLFLFFSIVVIWLIFIKISLFLAKWFENNPKLPQKYSKAQTIWNFLQKLVKSLNAYADFSRYELLFLISIGILGYLVGLVSYVLIARSTGITISIFDLGWIRSVILLAALLPFSFAGGIGIREVSLVVLLSLYNVDVEMALAFSLLLFTRNITLSLTGGALELWESIRKRKAI